MYLSTQCLNCISDGLVHQLCFVKDHETQCRGVFISALGHTAFLQSRGIWGLLCRLAMSCAILAVPIECSRDGERGWDLVGSLLALEAHRGREGIEK